MCFCTLQGDDHKRCANYSACCHFWLVIGEAGDRVVNPVTYVWHGSLERSLVPSCSAGLPPFTFSYCEKGAHRALPFSGTPNQPKQHQTISFTSCCSLTSNKFHYESIYNISLIVTVENSQGQTKDGHNRLILHHVD